MSYVSKVFPDYMRSLCFAVHKTQKNISRYLEHAENKVDQGERHKDSIPNMPMWSMRYVLAIAPNLRIKFSHGAILR